MAKVIHYVKLERLSQVLKLTKELKSLRKDNSLKVEVAAACDRIIEKASLGRYLIIDGTYRGSLAGEVIFIIQNASVWRSKPQSYGCERDDYIIGLPMEKVPIEYSKLLEILKSIFNTNSNLNSKNNGKDQDQLQGKENPDSGSYEGGILYGGGNRPQLTAGRHCDQAGAEIQGTRIGRGKIHLSSRCPEILVTPQRCRISEEWSSQSEGTPGRAGIQCDCNYFIDDNGDEIAIRLKSSKSDCKEVGDSYLANDGTLFILIGWDYRNGCQITKFSMSEKV